MAKKLKNYNVHVKGLKTAPAVDLRLEFLKKGKKIYEFVKMLESDLKIVLSDLRHQMNELYSDSYVTMTEIPDELDSSALTTMSSMFFNCEELMSAPELDASNVVNTSYMFANCHKLMSVPKLDTSNVTNMSWMFDSCINLTSIPQLDISSVTTMQAMFRNCTNLTSIPELNTSNVEHMQEIFKNCTNLTSIPELNTNKVFNMKEMFKGCKSLPTDFPWVIQCGNIGSPSKYMSNMFYDTPVTNVKLKNVRSEYKSSITSQLLKGDDTLTIKFIEIKKLNISKNTMAKAYPDIYQTMTEVPDELDVSQLTKFDSMFKGCTNLISVPQLDASGKSSMTYMFSGCANLTSIPQMDTSAAYDMRYMFENCTSLPETFLFVIDCGGITTANAMQNMFKGSSVTKVAFANVKEGIKSQFTSQKIKGDDTLTVEFV